jgi:hypothetical protein
MRRFKYFHKTDDAKQFLDGAMFCWNAAYYRDYEDAKAAQVVGDEYEGRDRPLNGLEITNVTQHTQGGVLLGAEFITMARETFVYCASMSFNDALENEFDAKACVAICDPPEFIQRWQRAKSAPRFSLC